MRVSFSIYIPTISLIEARGSFERYQEKKSKTIKFSWRAKLKKRHLIAYHSNTKTTTTTKMYK